MTISSEEFPAKRAEVLYSRITAANKKFLEDTAEEIDVSESHLVDHIISDFRKTRDSDKKKPRRKTLK